MKKQFDKLKISFENVECIDINKKYIQKLNLSLVHTFDNYSYQYGLETDRFKTTTKIADIVNMTIDIDGLDKSDADRLTSSDDIVGVGLHYQGDPDDQWTIIDVPWLSRRDCNTANLYQSVESYLNYSFFDQHPMIAKTWSPQKRKLRKELEEQDPFLNHHMVRIVIEKY